MTVFVLVGKRGVFLETEVCAVFDTLQAARDYKLNADRLRNAGNEEVGTTRIVEKQLLSTT